MKVTQKLIRNTEIRNLQINKDFYNDNDWNSVVMAEFSFYLFDDPEYLAEFSFYLFDDTEYLRLRMEYVSRLEVVEESGFFTNVAILKDGTKVFVNL